MLPAEGDNDGLGAYVPEEDVTDNGDGNISGIGIGYTPAKRTVCEFIVKDGKFVALNYNHFVYGSGDRVDETTLEDQTYMTIEYEDVDTSKVLESLEGFTAVGA